VWDELERLLGYRVNDANQEQAFVEASRRPTDRYYHEFVAAKRQLEPGVIVRRNIGQVLGVGDACPKRTGRWAALTCALAPRRHGPS
jgi:hypothetical protein